MKKNLLALVFILDLCLRLSAPDAEAQYPPPYCPPGTSSNSPPVMAYPPIHRGTPLQTLMYVRLAGPEGMKVTFYRGQGQAVKFDAPVIVGLRPGYTYRIGLSDMKKFPGQTFFPTLEVRGSLLLGGNLRAVDFPAGIFFKDEDFKLALEVSLIKKVVFLEKVETALPKASSVNEPIEIPVPESRDPLAEARERGLPLIIVEMGERREDEQDLINQAIFGTVLLPGDRYLPLPSRIPCMPWTCYPLYDPLLGPAPWYYYRLPDGGDWGAPAGFDRNGQLVGVDPADTVGNFKDSKGIDRLAVSNRVYLCIPRYLIARGESGIFTAAVSNQYILEANQTSLAQQIAKTSRLPLDQTGTRALELNQTKVRASGTDNVIGTQITAKVQNVDIKVMLRSPESIAGSPAPKVPEALQKEDGPLLIIKWPDDCGGIVGAIMTFYIRFTNRGGRPMTDVVITDSLISRFEYVPGTAKTDREASFTTQPNEVGSTILRWEFPGALQPGESGTVSFKFRVR